MKSGKALTSSRKPPFPKRPIIRDVIRQIAMLGGFLGRKSEREPGAKTFWLDFQRIRDSAVGSSICGQLQLIDLFLMQFF
jgi:Transposase Tn5 dimerisation domain